MLTRPEFSALLNVTSVAAVWTEAKPPHRTANIRAIIAPIDKSFEVLVNSYGIEGLTIQFLADAIPTAPAKFDAVAAGGKSHVIESVIEQRERGSDTLIYYVCHCKS